MNPLLDSRNLPDLLIVRLDRPLRSLVRLSKNYRLPILSVDRMLADLVYAQEKPNLTGQGMEDAVLWLLQNHGIGDIHIEEDDYHEAAMCFSDCLIYLRESFRALNPYVNGRLGYRYKERRGLQSVILERRPPGPT